MDPLSALSVACNIIQLLEIGYKGVNLCWEIYQNGCDVKSSTVIETSQHLELLTKDFSSRLSLYTGSKASSIPTQLLYVSNRCQVTAQSLNSEMKRLTIPARSNPLAVVGNAFKSIHKARDVQKLKDQLDEYQAILDTQILVHLSEQLKCLDERQTHVLSNLDQHTRQLAARMEAGETNVKDLVTVEHIQTRNEIGQLRTSLKKESLTIQTQVTDLASVIQDTSLQEQEQNLYKELLRTLYFPEMQLRQDSIEDAHRNTCEWILKDSTDRQLAWSPFVDWLSSDEHEMYWVQGKAGCGKSTLMTYLLEEVDDDDSRIRAQLPHNTMAISFFFWENGTFLENHIEGFYRSLLWQILNSCVLKPHNVPVGTALSATGISNCSESALTRKSLMRALTATIKRLSIPLFIIVDGLDEMCDDEGVINALHYLNNLPKTKICVSSRWSSTFEDFFIDSPKVRMQDLTRPDIELYVEDKLLSHPKVLRLAKKSDNQATRILRDIQDKAQGVFLWVKLVVRDVLRGLRNSDNFQILQQRIERMPKDINALYDHMWHRNSEDHELYQDQAAAYLRLILQRRMSLVEFSVAIEEAKINRILSAQRVDAIMSAAEEIDCEMVESWIRTRCAGFLEVTYVAPDDGLVRSHMQVQRQHYMNFQDDHFLGLLFNTYVDHMVDFTHRTVAEYLRDTENGRNIAGLTVAQEAQTELRSYRSRWCFWILCHVVGIYIPIPQRPSETLSLDIRNQTILHVEKVSKLLAQEGFLTTDTWSGAFNLRLAVDESIFPADNDGEIDFSTWMFSRGYADYVEWKQSVGLSNYSTEQCTNMLWIWATQSESNRQNHDLELANLHKHYEKYMHILTWLLEKGADLNHQLHDPRGDVTLSFLQFFILTGFDCESGSITNDLKIDAQALEKILTAGANPNVETKPHLRCFYPKLGHSCTIVWEWNSLGLIELLAPWGGSHGESLRSVLKHFNAKSMVRLLFLNCNDKLYPLSNQDSEDLKQAFMQNRNMSCSTDYSSWLAIHKVYKGTEPNNSPDKKVDTSDNEENHNEKYNTSEEMNAPIDIAIAEVISRTEPFPTRRDAMKFCGWTDQEIRDGEARYERCVAEVIRSREQNHISVKVPGVKPFVANARYISPVSRYWDDCIAWPGGMWRGIPCNYW